MQGPLELTDRSVDSIIAVAGLGLVLAACLMSVGVSHANIVDKMGDSEPIPLNVIGTIDVVDVENHLTSGSVDFGVSVSKIRDAVRYPNNVTAFPHDDFYTIKGAQIGCGIWENCPSVVFPVAGGSDRFCKILDGFDAWQSNLRSECPSANLDSERGGLANVYSVDFEPQAGFVVADTDSGVTEIYPWPLIGGEKIAGGFISAEQHCALENRNEGQYASKPDKPEREIGNWIVSRLFPKAVIYVFLCGCGSGGLLLLSAHLVMYRR